MKILLFGHQGQIGSALTNALHASDNIMTSDIDISDEGAIRDAIFSTAPDVIINSAAYTNVDASEDNVETAFQINANAPHVMAEAAKQNNILFVHYSTDYVYDGGGQTPWVETDTANPLNVYGQSKLKGDDHVTASGCRHLIFRTSWVYNKTHDNFATKILKLSHEREAINVISDQIGAPTSARFIAEATFHAINQKTKAGLYHLCCGGETSWFEYAELIIKTHNPTSTCRITPVLSKDYEQKARRPLNSRLNCDKFAQDFGLSIPDWNTEYLTQPKLACS